MRRGLAGAQKADRRGDASGGSRANLAVVRDEEQLQRRLARVLAIGAAAAIALVIVVVIADVLN